MKVPALTLTRYGGPEAFAIREVEVPAPGPGQVRVRVGAAGINFAEVFCRLGLYVHAPKPPFVPGFEFAGAVEAVGAGVGEPFAIGGPGEERAGNGGLDVDGWGAAGGGDFAEAGAAVEAFDEGEPVAIGGPGEGEDGVGVVLGQEADGAAAGGGDDPDLPGFGVSDAAAVGGELGLGVAAEAGVEDDGLVHAGFGEADLGAFAEGDDVGEAVPGGGPGGGGLREGGGEAFAEEFAVGGDFDDVADGDADGGDGAGAVGGEVGGADALGALVEGEEFG